MAYLNGCVDVIFPVLGSIENFEKSGLSASIVKTPPGSAVTLVMALVNKELLMLTISDSTAWIVTFAVKLVAGGGFNLLTSIFRSFRPLPE